MKIKITQLFLVLILISSCEKMDIQDQIINDPFLNQSEEYNTIMYKGVLINTPEYFDPKLLGLDDVTEYLLNNQLKNTKAKQVVDWSSISFEEIYYIIEKHQTKIPNLKEFFTEGKNAIKITKNFPSLNLKNLSIDQMEIIYEYYEALLKSYTVTDIASLLKSKTKSKIVGDINAYEAQLAAGSNITAYSWKQATDEATAYVKLDFANSNGCDPNGDNGNYNSYKHAVWNAIGVQEMMNWGVPKATALRRTADLASAHEYVVTSCVDCPNVTGLSNQQIVEAFKNDGYYEIYGNLPTGNRELMDLHNNLSGRTYMQNQIVAGLGLLTVPSDTKIRNYFKALAKNQSKCIALTSLEPSSMGTGFSWLNLGAIGSCWTANSATSDKLYRINDSCNVW